MPLQKLLIQRGLTFNLLQHQGSEFDVKMHIQKLQDLWESMLRTWDEYFKELGFDVENNLDINSIAIP